MTRRLTLRELDLRVQNELARGEWVTSTEIVRRYGLGHHEHYRVALLLERAVVDGLAEIKRPGAKGARRFRAVAA